MNDVEVFTRWRRMRDEGLAVPYGWLTLTSYQWLPAEPGSLELLPGRWSADATEARLQTGNDDGFTSPDGDPVTGTLRASVGEDESIHWVRHGDTLVELGLRASRYMIRTRTREHPRRAAFTGVPSYSYNPDWVMQGSYRPYAAPLRETIGSFRPDTMLQAEFAGEVQLELDGDVLPLAVQDDGNGTLTLTFFDETNGIETAPWRFVSFPAPGADGRVRVDFNRTLNYPMAFSEFAVCPAPLPGNLLPLAVTAGEKKPA